LTAEELLTPRNARILLGLGLAASGALLLAWQSHLTFLVDDWDLLLSRRGFNAHAFLDPHARHLVLGPALVYKAIQATLGMDTIVPYGIAAIALFLASVLLLFIYLSRRVGDWLALAAILPVLVMGTAYQDLLSAFQMGYFGSVAFGIGALLAIESADRRGDVVACALLLASLAFAEIALAFAAGVLVAIVLQRGPWRRLWIIAVPVLLYAVWYVSFGNPSNQPSDLSAHNLATSPPYVLDGFASSIASLFGLGAPLELSGTGALGWGRSLLVAFVALATIWVLRKRTPTRGWILVALVAGIAFWFITAGNFGFGRLPTVSRYQYVGAVFVLLIAGELAAGWQPGWKAIVAVFAVALAAALSNLAILHDGYRQLTGLAAIVRGDLEGLELAAERVNPDFALTPENADFNYFNLVRAGPYLSASKKFGSPAYSESELASSPEPARQAADKVLAAALPISLAHVASAAPPGRSPEPRPVGPPGAFAGRSDGCLVLKGQSGPAVVSLPPGGSLLYAAHGVQSELSLRRFASASFPVGLGRLRGTARLDIPSDRSARRWEMQVGATGKVKVCGQ
jgi:hypothetical protein